ncbi:hypothetical protein N9N42_01680 [Flavobacteriaceae bacterium]|nr:hypothetical protein [Flavobacteriaceae bacterium]
MLSFKLFFLTFFLSFLFSFSQELRSFVKYDFKNDKVYNLKLKELKDSLNKNSTSKLERKIADLAFYYKDWDTAIDFYEKVVLNAPKGDSYFRLSVAAGRKSLEVSRFYSISYLGKTKSALLKALEFQPNNPLFLRTAIEIFYEIPYFLGGDKEFAKEKAALLYELDPVEGLMAKGYLNEKEENLVLAKFNYSKAIKLILKEELEFVLNRERRDLAYELGRVTADFEINDELGITSLQFYLKNYNFIDNIALEWVYFNLAKISIKQKAMQKSKIYLEKALEIKPDFKQALLLKKEIK